MFLLLKPAAAPRGVQGDDAGVEPAWLGVQLVRVRGKYACEEKRNTLKHDQRENNDTNCVTFVVLFQKHLS